MIKVICFILGIIFFLLIFGVGAWLLENLISGRGFEFGIRVGIYVLIEIILVFCTLASFAASDGAFDKEV